VGYARIELLYDPESAVHHVSCVGQISTLPSTLFADENLLLGNTKVYDQENELTAVEGLRVSIQRASERQCGSCGPWVKP